MSDNNILFVIMGLRYMSLIMVMWRYPLIISALNGILMDTVSEVGRLVDMCTDVKKRESSRVFLVCFLPTNCLCGKMIGKVEVLFYGVLFIFTI